MEKWNFWTLFCLAVGFSLRILFENAYNYIRKGGKEHRANIEKRDTDRKKREQEKEMFGFSSYTDIIHYRVLDIKTGEMFYPGEIEKLEFEINDGRIGNIIIIMRNGTKLKEAYIPSEGSKIFDVKGNEFYIGDIVQYKGDYFAVNNNRGTQNYYLVNKDEKIDLEEASIGSEIVGTVFERYSNKDYETTCLNMVRHSNLDFREKILSQIGRAERK